MYIATLVVNGSQMNENGKECIHNLYRIKYLAFYILHVTSITLLNMTRFGTSIALSDKY